MSDDIVQWLRQTEDELYGATRCREAANEIERLRAALRFYAEYTPTLSAQDFRSVARAALEGKDD